MSLAKKVLLNLQLLLDAKNPASFWAFFIKLEDIFMGKLGFKERYLGRKKIVVGLEISFFADTWTALAYYEIFKVRAYSLVSDFLPQRGDIVVDLGAHQGIYTCYAAKGAVDGMVYAVEPEPNNFNWLKRHLKRNNIHNVKCINKCIASYIGNTLFEKGKGSSMSGHIAMKNQTDGIEVIKVEISTLDNIVREFNIDHINILKIDIEGAELDSLKGAEETLKHTDRIVMEYHSEELRKKIENHLYNIGFIEVACKKLLSPILYFVNRGVHE